MHSHHNGKEITLENKTRQKIMLILLTLELGLIPRISNKFNVYCKTPSLRNLISIHRF